MASSFGGHGVSQYVYVTWPSRGQKTSCCACLFRSSVEWIAAADTQAMPSLIVDLPASFASLLCIPDLADSNMLRSTKRTPPYFSGKGGGPACQRVDCSRGGAERLSDGPVRRPSCKRYRCKEPATNRHTRSRQEPGSAPVQHQAQPLPGRPWHMQCITALCLRSPLLGATQCGTSSQAQACRPRAR